MSKVAQIVSSVLGWLAFAVWSLSFYPQAILNWRRKSVDGLSLEYLNLNVLAFAAYTVYNTSLYASPSVRQEYADRHQGSYPAVQPNDVAFAAHAFVISCFTLGQTFVYTRGPDQALSRRFLSAYWTTLAIIAATLIGARAGWLSMLDALYLLGYIKLVCSFVKYLPQLVLNFRRRSTLGWSIENILCDFTGGLLQTVQLLIDSFTASPGRPWDGVRGNLPKLGLGLLSMSFDTLFLLQHFLWFGPQETDPAPEAESLLQA